MWPEGDPLSIGSHFFETKSEKLITIGNISPNIASFCVESVLVLCTSLCSCAIWAYWTGTSWDGGGGGRSDGNGFSCA